MIYELFYWPSIPGRGELVRLALEEAGAEYVDVARLDPDKGGGTDVLARVLGEPPGHFAPPVLRGDGISLSQTAAILDYLGSRHPTLLPEPSARHRALQLQLTFADFLAEAHDTHHPISAGGHYEEQKAEAKRRAAAFRETRIAKFMGYFESVLTESASTGSSHLLPQGFSYADLSAFQIVVGLAYAFPKAFEAQMKSYPRVLALRDYVSTRERIAAYLASPRRLPFSDHGLFRHYPELDRS